MFKGFKKRFSSNRSGRNRRLVSGGREQETAPREPPDKGGSKPTSPRQVHPADQISPVPYARRSLERRSRTIPSGKNAPAGNPCGFDRRTESFCLSPTKDQHQMSTSLAYPTTPNICVTGGKIEFITPPGSTLSSNASGNCSTLLSSPSLSSTPSPKGESPQRSRSTLPVNKTQKHSPCRRNSSRRRKSPKLSTSPATCNSSDRIKSPLITPPPLPACTDGDKRASDKPVKEEREIELQTLRQENQQIKKELSALQEEYSKLQEYAKDLEHQADEQKCQVEETNHNEPSQFQILVERCSTLEQVNAQLQADSVHQRQQYEKCLDKVASKVVQAILVQKTQQEQCERLTKRVEDLQQQNITLSSFIASKGKFQSLNYCRKAHLLPTPLSSSNANSQSLPNTLIKAKENCDTTNLAINENTACWYNNNNNNNNNKEKPTSHSNPRFKKSRTHSDINPVLPTYGSSSLPQSGSSKKRSLHHQASADGCWYDIIKSLQTGETSRLNGLHSIADNNNTSSDSSSVDTEERNLDSENRTLPCIEDVISTSSSGDDFLALSFPSTSRNQHQHPSNPASNSRTFNPGIDCSLVSSSQYSNSNTLSAVRRGTPDITLDFNPPYNTIVANFSVTENPKLDNKDISSFKCEKSSSVISSNSISKINNHSPEEQTKIINESETKLGEGIVKDEGYSTMSSDVQSETKDNIAVVTISTVVEERGKSLDGESEIKEESSTDTLKTNSASRETLKIEHSNNKKNMSLSGVVSLSINDVEQSQPEYSDELRFVYDDDANSDILYIPIAEQCDKYMRHSFNFPFPAEPFELQRCSSDSYLYKLYVRFPNGNRYASKKLSTNQNALQSLPLKQQNNIYNTYLRRAFRKENMKRECLKLFNRPLFGINGHEGKSSANSINYHFLSQIFPPSISHPRILSPSYSHAEMEDWSLDLSGEDITTPGGTEPSAAESSAPSHHQSQPSIQEAPLELEEDHHDFLWNGATYFKAEDSDLSWPYDKSQVKSWDLNLVGNKQCRSMISPKSGCSDQPAMWSSSEQLSCCSDIASKCSTDIENFCEQLCNLPELKRVSVCSSENGGNESLPSNKLSEVDSNEDASEVLDEDTNVETVFTRDFYRLVKFESTKSLTASSKSLATSEGFLTLEKLKGLESLHNNKTLASVLGFIAEQQKYCKDREVMDENAAFGPVNKTENLENSEASFLLRVSGDSQLNNDMENVPEKRTVQDNVLTTSESCVDLNTEFRNSFSCSRGELNPPPKPKRSTSLNLGVRGGPSYRSRGTLPPLPSSYSPPPIPSRSTSRSTLPHHIAFAKPRNKRDPSLEIPEETFPPPPSLDDSYVEPYHAIPMAPPPPPKVPPHRIPIPVVPKRSSSISSNSNCDSPPVPKRITSRALPVPPPVIVPTRSTSLEGGTIPSNVEQKFRNKLSRPKSLLKEASNTTSKVQERQKRGSCGDLGPLCRNSATLMLELQKMAKAEEEEKGSSGFYSPEATSPGTEMGLGTGWVRIEPITNLGDPQTRANLLDNMLQSSEGCSSETDEDLAKHLQHTELLKAVQRNRRKRKVLRHNVSDPIRVVDWSHSQRPTILGRNSLFNRYGEEEEDALKEFHFLESFPSSDVGTNDHVHPSPFLDSREDHSPLHSSSYSPSYVRPTAELKHLRSSEPCPDISDYPLSSISQLDASPASNRPSLNMRSNYVNPDDNLSYGQSFVSSNVNRSSFRLHSNIGQVSIESPYMNHTSFKSPSIMGETSIKSPNMAQTPCKLPNMNKTPFGSSSNKDQTPAKSSYIKVLDENSVDRKKKANLFPSFERLANGHSMDVFDNKSPHRNVPSPRPNKTCTDFSKTSNLTFDTRQSCLDEKANLEQKLKLGKSRIPTNKVDGLSRTDVHSPSKDGSEESDLVDTRSLSNVKETIQKLNRTSSTSLKLKNSPSKVKNDTDLHSVSSPHLKPFTCSTKISPPDSSVQVADNCSPSSKIESIDTKICSNSKRTPKLPGSNLIKRITANSPQSRELSAALPPKGSPFRAKDRQTPSTKTPLKTGGVLGKGLRSPRLPRFKLGGMRSDPLASFNGKSMCDSGSSEGSEKGYGGRLSISDSCAEIFSPGESGDEVFLKHS